MNGSLGQYIEHFGGKHGGLLFAKEYGVAVPNSVIWKRWDTINFDQIKQVCREAQERNGKIIIRTSVPDDWRGIIDQMPTKVYSISRMSEADFMKTVMAGIAEVEQFLDEDETLVKEHAVLENTQYDAKSATISISPYYGDVTGMITEHPNFSDGLLVDVRETGGQDDEHRRSDFFQWKRVDNPEISDAHLNDYELWQINILRDNAEKVRQAIRALGIDDDMTYQFECCWDSVTKQPILLQIREFTPRKTLQLSNWTIPNLRYFMGNDGSRITLPIVVETYLDQFEKRDMPYTGIIEHGFGQYRKWNLANNAQWIIVTVQSCLGHILTQPTVSVVKRWGFALLDVQHNHTWNYINEQNPISVFHDSARWIQWEQEEEN